MQVELKYIEWNISAKYFFGIYSIITYKEYLFLINRYPCTENRKAYKASGLVIGKLKLTTTQCIVHGIIRSSGIVVNVRNIAENIRDKSTDLIKGLSNA